MKIVGLVFSARKKGNGFNFMKYCLDRFEEKGFETRLVNVFDFDIKPCSHCNYECYSEEIRDKHEDCPVKDDVAEMFELTRDADGLMIIVPCYGGHTAAIYKAWTERVPHLPELNRLFKNDFAKFQELFLNKIKGFIIIGNLTAMGDMTLHEVLADFYNIEPPDVLLIQSREYSAGALKGNLIKIPAVRERLERFVELLARNLKK